VDTALRIVEVLAGLLLIAYVAWDVFNTVALPRPTPSIYLLAPNLTRYAWRAWRWQARRMAPGQRRERWLGAFAPLLVLVLLVAWVLILIVGFGLIDLAFGSDFDPPVRSLATAFYAAGTGLLTIGFGDIVPTASVTRLVVIASAGLGLGTVALVITYLFSLYGSFQRREVLVTTLDARAGAPPSGVALLETSQRTGLLDDLPALFSDWERWAAEVLDSHVAFPILGYFRSSHDSESWVASLGAMLDAAVLILTTVENQPRGRAEMLLAIGVHLVEDVSAFFGFSNDGRVGVERAEYDAARLRLEAAGFQLEAPDIGWILFAQIRARYASRLNELAGFWMTPPALWIGDRDHEVHHASTEAPAGS
jgi:ABC-type multidrug transport system fused ATPase/permease subunit